jgi:hypothetical protein
MFYRCTSERNILKPHDVIWGFYFGNGTVLNDYYFNVDLLNAN